MMDVSCFEEKREKTTPAIKNLPASIKETHRPNEPREREKTSEDLEGD